MSIDALEGTKAAPPRDNGELVFSEPWQARAFGLAADLVEGGKFTWDEFREHLVKSIAQAEQQIETDTPSKMTTLVTAEPLGSPSEASEPWDYYQHWLTALEHSVVDNGLTTPQALLAQAALYAARPDGHDH